MSSRITIRQIAACAGMHFTTVALALRDSPKINIATRNRLQKLAAEMGYRPDPMLSALQAYKRTVRRPHYQATIAWINNWPEREQLLCFHEFRAYYEGAKSRADELGYQIEEFWMHKPGVTPDRIHKVLRARGIQAMLLPPQPRAHMWLDFDYSEFSALALGYSLHPPRLHVITNHHLHSITLLLEHLWSLGYRRPGMYIDYNWDAKVGNSWAAGMLLHRWQHASGSRIPIVVKNAQQYPIDSWVKKYRPDVVVSFNNNLPALHSVGLAVPDEIGFASLNVTDSDQLISGICQNDRLIGYKSVDLLVDMLHRGERGIPAVPIRTLVEGTLNPGSTLKRCKPGRRRCGR